MRGLFLLSVFVVLSLGMFRNEAKPLTDSGCSSNIKELFEQGVANGTDPTQIMCTDGVWTIPGDVILNSGKLYVNNDTLNIGGSLKFGSVCELCTPFCSHLKGCLLLSSILHKLFSWYQWNDKYWRHCRLGQGPL